MTDETQPAAPPDTAALATAVADAFAEVVVPDLVNAFEKNLGASSPVEQALAELNATVKESRTFEVIERIRVQQIEVQELIFSGVEAIVKALFPSIEEEIAELERQ